MSELNERREDRMLDVSKISFIGLLVVDMGVDVEEEEKVEIEVEGIVVGIVEAVRGLVGVDSSMIVEVVVVVVVAAESNDDGGNRL